MIKERIDDRLYLEKVEKIGAICKDLGVLVPVSFWQFKVEGGEEVIFVSQSFTNNARRLMGSVALNYALTHTVSLIELRIRSIDNVLFTTTSTRLHEDLSIGGAGVANQGIIIGTSNALEDPESPALISPILEGTTTGRVQYQSHHVFSIVNNTAMSRLEVTQSRRFLNNSGGDIGVNEVGLYCFDSISGFRYMMIRDQLPATVTIPNAGQLTVTLLKTVPNW